MLLLLQDQLKLKAEKDQAKVEQALRSKINKTEFLKVQTHLPKTQRKLGFSCKRVQNHHKYYPREGRKPCLRSEYRISLTQLPIGYERSLVYSMLAPSLPCDLNHRKYRQMDPVTVQGELEHTIESTRKERDKLEFSRHRVRRKAHKMHQKLGISEARLKVRGNCVHG